MARPRASSDFAFGAARISNINATANANNANDANDAAMPAAPDDSGPDAAGDFTSASVFVVCLHGAVLARSGGIWRDFGDHRAGIETPRETAFRGLQSEIGLKEAQVEVAPDQPVWVVCAGLRHAVFVATLSETVRRGLDFYDSLPRSLRGDFVDFGNFFRNDMFGSEVLHRRLASRAVFDDASDAYVSLCRIARRARTAAYATVNADSSDVDDDASAPPVTLAAALSAARTASGLPPLVARHSAPFGAGASGAVACAASAPAARSVAAAAPPSRKRRSASAADAFFADPRGNAASCVVSPRRLPVLGDTTRRSP